MKPKTNPLLRASRLALIAITFGALPAIAGTIWDGVKNDLSPAADTNINNAENWDGDALPVFDGTASVKFTGGTTAVVNAASYFNAMTFDNPAGFDLASGDRNPLDQRRSGKFQHCQRSDRNQYGFQPDHQRSAQGQHHRRNSQHFQFQRAAYRIRAQSCRRARPRQRNDRHRFPALRSGNHADRGNNHQS